MNLLTYHSRFAKRPYTFRTADEIAGYTAAMQDIMRYLEQVTQFDPRKRVVDAVTMIESIVETNEKVNAILQQIKIDVLEYEKN